MALYCIVCELYDVIDDNVAGVLHIDHVLLGRVAALCTIASCILATEVV